MIVICTCGKEHLVKTTVYASERVYTPSDIVCTCGATLVVSISVDVDAPDEE
jgi:hypothetical protein